MAKPYFDNLNALLDELALSVAKTTALEVKHFFSGAALYANGTLCASWSPPGLAFKLPGSQAEELIAAGQAQPLKYFEKGRIKKGYAVFSEPEKIGLPVLKEYFLRAVDTAVIAPAKKP